MMYLCGLWLVACSFTDKIRAIRDQDVLGSNVNVALIEHRTRKGGGQYENLEDGVIWRWAELPKELPRNDSHVFLFQASDKESSWEASKPKWPGYRAIHPSTYLGLVEWRVLQCSQSSLS